MTENSKQKLARYLRVAGLEEMAKQAERGYYHDFESPLTFPEMQLEQDLREARDAHNRDFQRYMMIERIRVLHIADGAFDATKEESDEWAASPEGRAAFAELGEVFIPPEGNDNGKSGS